MGHKRKAKAAPSPIELLSILTAKESGIPIEVIMERTQYARSTILRWYKAWGHETAFVEAINCEHPSLFEPYSFEMLFPKSVSEKALIKEEANEDEDEEAKQAEEYLLKLAADVQDLRAKMQEAASEMHFIQSQMKRLKTIDAL